jgi:hypothetical protein
MVNPNQEKPMTVVTRNLAVALAMTTALTMTGSIVSAQNDQGRRASADSGDRTIVGVWRTVVTPRNCQTGEQVAPAFRGLTTFHAHGILSEYGVGPGSSPALRSPGHGVWQREQGWHDYSFALTFNRYNATGAFIGSQTVRAALELGGNGDEFTTQIAADILDANDRVVVTTCATSVGTRFD